jgi:hypothetical protein
MGMSRAPVYRVTRNRGPDPLTRRLIVIAGGLSVALVAVVVLWSSIGHRSGAVPVVQADPKPVRFKPTNPGGMQIPGLSADTGQASDTAATDKLAPAPETPDPQALSQMRTAAATPPAATPPVAAQAAATAAPTAVKPVAGAAAPVSPERHAAPAMAHAPAGRTQVQLAAVGSEAAARQEWDRLAHRMPTVLGSRHPLFSKIDHDGHVLWRVRTGDFTNEAEASQFCQQVRAKGSGCTVATF